MAFLDATVRLVPGRDRRRVPATSRGPAAELDHPAYTRPPTFRGVDVPDVLLSGNHAKIAGLAARAVRARAEARNRAAGDDRPRLTSAKA